MVIIKITVLESARPYIVMDAVETAILSVFAKLVRNPPKLSITWISAFRSSNATDVEIRIEVYEATQALWINTMLLSITREAKASLGEFTSKVVLVLEDAMISE